MSRERLVIAGAGVAGLLAAAATASEFDEVLVVDRQLDPDRFVTAPQAAQLHNVLTRGQRHLEELLPGFRERLLAKGAREGSVSDETHIFEFDGIAAERPLGMRIWSAPLGLLWSTTRALLPEGVRLVAGEVDRVELDDGKVRAVAVNAHDTGPTTLTANGVVDATGYAGNMCGLLTAAGAQSPAVSEVSLNRWFVTVRLRRPENWRGADDFWMTFSAPPHRDSALLSPAGTDEWTLLVSSEAGGRPPQSQKAIGEFLDRLPGTPLRPMLDAATVISPPAHFRRQTARWRHFEEHAASPGGFVPVGDAYAAINPTFGTGVSMAAWEASLLRTALRDQSSGGDWSKTYLAAAADAVAQAWALDKIPTPALPVHAWIALASRIASDADTHRRYVGLWHLVEPTSTLLTLATHAQPGLTSDDNA